MRHNRPRDGTRASENKDIHRTQLTIGDPSKSLNEYPTNKLDQAGLLQYQTKSRAVIIPSTTRKSELLTCQPSTNRVTDTNASIDMSPDVRASQITMDLHDALRFNLPPFQQSRRWTKTYMSEKYDTVSRLSASDLHRKEQYLHTYSSRRQTDTPGPDTVGIGENKTGHHGLCQLAYLPGWQAWKQRRQPRRSCGSADTSRIARPRNIRRRKSTKFLKARFHEIQFRVSIPKAVQSNCGVKEENQGLVTGTFTTPKISRHGSEFLCSLFPNQTDVGQQCSNSSVSSLHDYEKVKRFSQECVDMLSGLDFGEEWRLSFVNPDFSLPWKSSLEPHSPTKQTSKPDNDLVTNSKATAMQRADKPSQSLAFDAEQQPFTTRVEHQSQAASTLRQTASLVNESPLSSIGDRSSRCNKASAPSADHKVGNEALNLYINHFDDRVYAQNLNTTRSVDTLTEIEAQVDAPHITTHGLAEKDSSLTISSSPNRQQPLGEPPGRPLPSIPTYQSCDSRSEIHKCSSFASSHRNKVILDALELVDPFKSISTRPTIKISNGIMPMSMQSKSGYAMRDSSQTSKHRLRSLNSRSTSVQSLMHNSDENKIPAHFVSEEVGNHQSSRNQHTKSGNLTIWNRSQETFSSSSWEAGTGQSTTSIEPEPQQTGSPRKVSIQKLVLQGRSRKFNSTNGTEQRYPVQNCSSRRTTSIYRNPSADDVSAITRTRIPGEVGGTKSRAGPSHQNLANQCKKLQSAVSLPHIHQQSGRSAKPKQPLGNSQIMVVVDTNPHTSAFRAGALSPCPNSVVSENRPTTPLCDMSGRQLTRDLHPRSVGRDHTPQLGSSESTGLIDIVKPPSSVQKRQSLRGLKYQGSSTQVATPSSVKQIPERISSAKATSRSMSRPSRALILDSSDSDLGDSPLTKGSSSSASKSRTKTRSSRPNFQLRKDTPLTSKLKAQVRNADKEYEDLKEYEKRIEQLQQHLEQTMKVWGRMSQNGRRQYLSSTFGTIEQKCNTCTRAWIQTEDDDIASLATSSVYTRGSNVQKMHDSINESFNEALEFTQRALDESRHVFGAFPPTTACTNTDIENDGSTASEESSIAKRTSGGSLTDPHDYDLPPSPLSHRSTGRTCTDCDQTLKQKRSNLSSSTLNNFRARLQASRPVGMMTRRYRSQVALRATEPKVIEIRPATGLAAVKVPLAERFAIAPWERLEHHPKRDDDIETSASVARSVPRMDNPFLELSDETLSTDQMDAMLGL